MRWGRMCPDGARVDVGQLYWRPSMSSATLMNLARRLLHLWVRLRVFPESPVAVDAARPVCYALRESWLSDRLVLREAVARAGLPGVDRPLRLGRRRLASADFALARGWRPFGRARAIHGMPPRLQRLIQALADDPAADVQIVPVTVLWGRAPRQQDGILRALLAESWQRRHPFGHWLAVLIHGRQTHVHFGQPYSLRALLQDAADPLHATRKAARLLRGHFRRQRELAIGPDVSHRHTQVEALLAMPAVQTAIGVEAASRRIAPEQARERARRHALAIASDYSYSAMRAAELFLAWVWTRLFDGVEVRNLDLPRSVAPGQSIVYLPCHRSHIDYLLVSYILYRAGMSPPHIAAGENLDLPVLGRILRGGGAFFLRRSFKGDPLYATVFGEYLHRMLAQGFPLEYFIEGGRSRSGRLLPPKTGLLAMTVHSFLRRHERPLVFVPIYLGYEKLAEGASFVEELSGRPKQRESLLGLFSAARVLRRHFGRVYVNFGAPLALAEWLDAHHPGWRTSGDGEEQRAASAAIADELARRINDAALVNPVNLVALALLAAPHASADAVALARQIEHLRALVDAGQMAAPQEGAACIAAALRLGSVRRLDLADGARIVADAREAAMLAYFRNNVLHLYALPALVASLLVQHEALTESRLDDMAAGLFGLLRDSLFLRCTLGDLPRAVDGALARLASRGLVERAAGWACAPRAGSEARTALAWIGETVRPLLTAVSAGSR